MDEYYRREFAERERRLQLRQSKPEESETGFWILVALTALIVSCGALAIMYVLRV